MIALKKMMLKGKLYKHVFINEGIRRDCGMYVLPVPAFPIMNFIILNPKI